MINDQIPCLAGRQAMIKQFSIFNVQMFKKGKYLLLTGIFLGLALSSKWTALYGIALCAIVYSIWYLVSGIQNTKYKILNTIYFLLCGFLAFIVIPAVVYLISYIPFFLSGHNWEQFMEVTRQMWWYHTNLKATHGYQSIALSWPLMIRPVWYYVKYGEGVIANIYAIGNPLIWWPGVAAVIVATVFSIQYLVYSISYRTHTKYQILNTKYQILLPLLAYFAFLVPWMFSPRIMFLYHYLPSLSFLILILSGILSRLMKYCQQSRVAVIGYFCLVVVVFVYFYPHNTAMMVPSGWANQYYWLPSWR